LTLDNGTSFSAMARKRASRESSPPETCTTRSTAGGHRAGAGCRAPSSGTVLERRAGDAAMRIYLVRHSEAVNVSSMRSGAIPERKAVCRSGMALRFRDAGDIPRGFSPAVRPGGADGEICRRRSVRRRNRLGPRYPRVRYRKLNDVLEYLLPNGRSLRRTRAGPGGILPSSLSPQGYRCARRDRASIAEAGPIRPARWLLPGSPNRGPRCCA